MDFTLTRLKYPTLIAATGLVMGLITDLLIYEQPLGISVPIVFALLIVAMLALALGEGQSISLANVWLIIPLLFLAIMYAVRAAPLLRALNFIGALLLLLLLSNRLLNNPIFQLNLWDYGVAFLESSIIAPFMSIPLVQRAFKSIGAAGDGRSSTVRRVLVGFALAVPFLIVFTALFASADLVFNRLVTDVFEDLSLEDVFGHAFLTALFGFLFMGGLAYTLSRTESAPVSPAATADPDKNVAPPPSALPSVKGRLGAIEAFVVLFSVNALFLVFVAIQFAAMFGGEAFLRSQGLTYSEYARRGFFELLAVAIITLSLILVLDYLTGRETPTQRTIFLAGAGLMTAMTIIILGSAYQRLQLYELAYGFSELRVQSHIFMIWLAVLMIAFFVLLLTHRPHLFATALMLVTIGFVATLDVLNQDAFIVQQNLARARAGEELDLDYLGSLSEDAIPLLVPLYTSGDEETRAALGPWLRYRLVQLEDRQDAASWASYHFAINQAYQLLSTREDSLDQYDLPSEYRFLD